MVTDRPRQVYDFVQAYTARHGYVPKLREIAERTSTFQILVDLAGILSPVLTICQIARRSPCEFPTFPVY